LTRSWAQSTTFLTRIAYYLSMINSIYLQKVTHITSLFEGTELSPKGDDKIPQLLSGALMYNLRMAPGAGKHIKFRFNIDPMDRRSATPLLHRLSIYLRTGGHYSTGHVGIYQHHYLMPSMHHWLTSLSTWPTTNYILALRFTLDNKLRPVKPIKRLKEWDSQGQAIFAIAEYYRFTHDKKILETYYPHIHTRNLLSTHPTWCRIHFKTACSSAQGAST